MADSFILRPGTWLMRRLGFSSKRDLLAGVAVSAQLITGAVQAKMSFVQRAGYLYLGCGVYKALVAA